MNHARPVALAGVIAVGAWAALPAGAHAAPTDDPSPSEPVPDAVPTAEAESGPLFDVCPVAGPSTFEDSWGWARSGGRSHEGVDMVADRGTPVIAVRDGFAQFKTNGLGGRAIWLTAPNGDKFYYAHLDDWVGESREVRAGDHVGFIGSTGNAHGPHLHFETLPGGHVENPYGHTLAACVPTPAEPAAVANRLDDPDVWSRFIPA